MTQPVASQHRWSTSLVAVSSLIGGVVIGWWSQHMIRTFYRSNLRMKSPVEIKIDNKTTAYETLIGNTPCILLPNISKLIGREIYVKCENYNPGGSGKDRAAYNMILKAEQRQHLPPSKQRLSNLKDARTGVHDGLQLIRKLELSSDNSECHPYDAILRQALERSITGGIVVEGTSGSTGISLAHIAIAKGHSCIVVLPDDQAKEKQTLLNVLHVLYHVVPTASISSPNHYVNIAKSMAQRAVQLGIKCIFIDQFNNSSNHEIHYNTTGPEIHRQCRPHAFIMSAGTGGTISGVAMYLKQQDPTIRIVLADPFGSVLFSKIEYGVAYTSQQQERASLRHRYDTIAEGIGLDRVTDNMKVGLDYIDNAITVNDQDAVDMAHYLLRMEGLMIGSSSAINIFAAIKVSKELPVGSRICTIICDTGLRHVTRFWNREFILSSGLSWPSTDDNSQGVPNCLKGLVLQ